MALAHAIAASPTPGSQDCPDAQITQFGAVSAAMPTGYNRRHNGSISRAAVQPRGYRP